MAVVQSSQSARPHHIGNSAILYSKEISLVWLTWWQHMLHTGGYITHAIASVARSSVTSPSVCCIPTRPDLPWAHHAINSSTFRSQSRSTWAIPILVSLSHLSHLLWQCSKISAFWPIHNLFQNSWWIGFSHLDSLDNQYYPLIPCSTGHVMCGGNVSSEHPVWHGKSQCQEETCFCPNNFWGRSNPLIVC